MKTTRDRVVQLEWCVDNPAQYPDDDFEGVVIDVKRPTDFRCHRIYLKRAEAVDVAHAILGRYEAKP